MLDILIEELCVMTNVSLSTMNRWVFLLSVIIFFTWICIVCYVPWHGHGHGDLLNKDNYCNLFLILNMYEQMTIT